MSNSRNLFCYFIISVCVISSSLAQTQKDWSKSSNCQEKKIEKEVKALVKEYKKQGLEADVDIGSSQSQITNRLEMKCQEFKISATSRYAQPRFTFQQGKATHEILSEAVIIARKNALQGLKRNAGGTFAGMIKDEESFVTNDGVNIRKDLSSSVIKQLVEGELDRNEVITQFFKTGRDGSFSVTMVIAVDNSNVIKKIQQISRDELDALLGLD